MNNEIYKRSVIFRDANKARWEVEFKVREDKRTQRNKKTLEEYTELYDVSVCASSGGSCGQCYDSIVPRTTTQNELISFWKTYHQGGWCSGTDRQTEYLDSEQYKRDFNDFVEIFSGYDSSYRNRWDNICDNVIWKHYDCLEQMPAVISIIKKCMNGNPIIYILGSDRFHLSKHGMEDYYVKCFFLAIRGIYNDSGYKYGSGFLSTPIPDDIKQRIDVLCDSILQEEKALTQELNTDIETDTVIDMGAQDFKATPELIDTICEMRDCDTDEAMHFIALGMTLGYTFGDLNDTFTSVDSTKQLYAANGIEYYIGTQDELTDIADDMLHDGDYTEIWKETVWAGKTEYGLEDWLQFILRNDGFESILNSWDGKYNEHKVGDTFICVCRS